jgi:hypothetical protein
MDLRFSMFPIAPMVRNWVGVPDGTFDDSLLPFQIVDDVYIEHVSPLIPKDEFDYCKSALGTETTKHLEQVEYAIIHRFPSIEQDPITGDLILEHELAHRSKMLVQEIVACLRLIRPTTQHAQFIGGSVEPGGKLRHMHFDNPFIYVSSLPNQRLFAIRTVDMHRLKYFAPLFVAAMEGHYWKYRMAVEMFQSGHFQHSHWKLRFFMWTAALEALFTSHTSSEHRGSLVAKERAKFLVGANTLIYPLDERLEYEADPKLTVADVIDEIYCLRNHIAHGDRVPDYYFRTPGRKAINGTIKKGEVLMESISSIVRQALLRILEKGLLNHFVDAAASEAYFTRNGLTTSAIGKRHYRCPS